jgi:DNA-binding MarR family transcriptional regulator
VSERRRTEQMNSRLLGMEIVGTCICLRVRRASRAVAQVWDSALAPGGLTNGQLAIIAQIKLRTSVTVAVLANSLRLERTSLTRNLSRLEALGAVLISVPPSDKRKRLITLTAGGERLLARAFPYWDDAQSRLMDAVGKKAWDRALQAAGRLTASVSDKPKSSPSRSSQKAERVTIRQAAGQLTPRQFEILQRQMCMCTTLRRCARALSKPYDQRLRPLQIKVSQFHLLAAIDAFPGTRLSGFVDILTLDQTSLSRMIHHLISVGLVEQYQDGPQQHGFVLTRPGKDLLQKGMHEWRRAQTAFGDVEHPKWRAQTKISRSLGSSDAPALVIDIANCAGPVVPVENRSV